MPKFQFQPLPVGGEDAYDEDEKLKAPTTPVTVCEEEEDGVEAGDLECFDDSEGIPLSGEFNGGDRKRQPCGVLCLVLFALTFLLSGAVAGFVAAQRFGPLTSAQPPAEAKDAPLTDSAPSTNEVGSEEDDGDNSADDVEDVDAEDSEPVSPSTALTVPDPKPPLHDLIHGEKVVGDVSWMLDFAIIGFAKCGTTFLMNYFKKNVNTYMPKGELCHMSRGQPALLAENYYDVERQTADGQPVRVGLKCPKEVQTEQSLETYVKYYPTTKFIITTRHPVHWFRSFYNFRLYKRWPKFQPKIKDLFGACVPGSPYVCDHRCEDGKQNVCTDRAKFHHSLSRFGKTPMTSPEELALLDHRMSVHPNPKAKIFLMELGQLNVSDVGSESLTKDLGDFLGVATELTPLREYQGKHSQYSEKERTDHFLDICEPRYKDLRDVLVDIGKEASTWIRDYFIKSPDVVVSSPERFVELIETWGKDPCDLL